VSVETGLYYVSMIELYDVLVQEVLSTIYLSSVVSQTQSFRGTLPEVFGSVGMLLLLTYRQTEAKTKV